MRKSQRLAISGGSNTIRNKVLGGNFHILPWQPLHKAYRSSRTRPLSPLPALSPKPEGKRIRQRRSSGWGKKVVRTHHSIGWHQSPKVRSCHRLPLPARICWLISGILKHRNWDQAVGLLSRSPGRSSCRN